MMATEGDDSLVEADRDFNSTTFAGDGTAVDAQRLWAGDGVASWWSGVDNTYSADDKHTSTLKPNSDEYRLRIANNGVHWPFTPNAGGRCNADQDFDNYIEAKQNCPDFPIVGIALSVPSNEMAATYRLKISVEGTPSDSHINNDV